MGIFTFSVHMLEANKSSEMTQGQVEEVVLSSAYFPVWVSQRQYSVFNVPNVSLSFRSWSMWASWRRSLEMSSAPKCWRGDLWERWSSGQTSSLLSMFWVTTSRSPCPWRSSRGEFLWVEGPEWVYPGVELLSVHASTCSNDTVLLLVRISQQKIAENHHFSL